MRTLKYFIFCPHVHRHAAACSAPVTAAAFYVIKLQGSYGLFYCVYLATLAVGIGE
jgi:hypothetical protein